MVSFPIVRLDQRIGWIQEPGRPFDRTYSCHIVAAQVGDALIFLGLAPAIRHTLSSAAATLDPGYRCALTLVVCHLVR